MNHIEDYETSEEDNYSEDNFDELSDLSDEEMTSSESPESDMNSVDFEIEHFENYEVNKDLIVSEVRKNLRYSTICNMNNNKILYPINYINHKFCVLFSHLFSMLFGWTQSNRSENIKYNYVNSSEYDDYVEENYNTVKTVKNTSFLMKYNNCNSWFSALMLHVFLFRNKMNYYILTERSNFKWYNKYFMRYFGYIPVDFSDNYNYQIMPYIYYFETMKKPFVIVDKFENLGDNSAFYLSHKMKLPTVIVNFDYRNQKMIVDGALNNNTKSLRYYNKTVYDRIGNYETYGKNEVLEYETGYFSNAFSRMSEEYTKYFIKPKMMISISRIVFYCALYVYYRNMNLINTFAYNVMIKNNLINEEMLFL